ncbi:ExbD/TolR family protein [Algibacillus agarilyticus]|uniref:ExbD/TolR family protein n=1 Tax=Algibacillus agarilyticus TaxID=2234133 RepID=UPI0013007CDD|nr:biopolymer transporter ExbD [Algibacillus agarilyticus]
MRINLDDQENFEPNLAPLLDCIFLLLIFFLVATTFDKEDHESETVKQLNIQLPSSAAAFSPTEIRLAPLVLGVDRHGKYYIDNKQVAVKDVHAILRKQSQTDPERRIRIDGDRNTPLQYMVHLLDLCEFEGLHNIGVRANDG